ncbi:hypothetical protein C5706_32690, partial [Klebsiella pneumoniae]
ALQAALDGAIARGEYQQVLARWGSRAKRWRSRWSTPPGITYLNPQWHGVPCRRLSTGRLPAVNISRCWRVGGAGRSGGAVG